MLRVWSGTSAYASSVVMARKIALSAVAYLRHNAAGRQARKKTIRPVSLFLIWGIRHSYLSDHRSIFVGTFLTQGPKKATPNYAISVFDRY